MAILGELLFGNRAGNDLDNALRHKAETGLRQAVETFGPDDFAQSTDDDLADRAIARCRIESLVLHIDRAEPSVVPTSVTVRDYGRQVTVKGYRVSKTIPFTGNPELWQLRPNPADLSPPRGEVRGEQLIIGFELSEAQAEKGNQLIDAQLADVNKYITNQTRQIEQYNASLRVQALPLVQQRKKYLNKGESILQDMKKK